MVHPIERLRYVARAGDEEPVLLAEEAALGLGAMSFDRRALVPASRRLLEAHPSCGPLWWVVAHLLVADDVRAAVNQALDELALDPTPEELAAGFPAGAVITSGLGSISLSAVSLRPDIEVHLLGPHRSLRSALRSLDGEVQASGFSPEEIDEALEDAQLVLVEALGAGPSGCILSESDARLVEEGAKAGLVIWAVVGAGRLLPHLLFEAMLEASGLAVREDQSATANLNDALVASELEEDSDDLFADWTSANTRAKVSFVKARSINWVIGPSGAMATGPALRQARFVAPNELLSSRRVSGRKGPRVG